MVGRTGIEWTEATWNPVTGCSKISQGCKHCYAERMAKRLKAMGVERYSRGFEVTLHPDLIDAPLRWRKPRIIFVNSMSDLFHEQVPLQFVKRVFATMNACRHHTFQILTKRTQRLRRLATHVEWTPNIWMGASVENADVLSRIDDLRTVPATIRFLSVEPLLGPLDTINLSGIHWVIVGGESGPHARPLQKKWIVSLLRQCRRARVPFFFKQWGGSRKDLTGRSLDGAIYNEMPELRVLNN